MREVFITKRFQKDLDHQAKRGRNIEKFKEIARKLAASEKLELKYRNHKLTGNYADHWECHIEPDWLLIYRITDTSLTLERTGTHSDLF